MMKLADSPNNTEEGSLAKKVRLAFAKGVHKFQLQRKALINMGSNKTIPDKLKHLKEVLEKPPSDRTTVDIKNLIKMTSNVAFFVNCTAKYGEDVHKELCKYITYEFQAMDQAVFKQGSKGDKFYIILQGIVTVRVRIYDHNNKTYEDKEVGDIREGGSFGELALIEGKPRAATILTKTDTHFAILQKKNYDHILGIFQRRELEAMVSFLHLRACFKHLPRVVVQNLSYFFESKVYGRGNVLYKEDEESHNIYFIRKGEIKLMKFIEIQEKPNDFEENPNTILHLMGKNRGIKKNIEIVILLENEIFGEEEVIENKRRMTSAVVNSSRVELLVISKKNVFRRLSYDPVIMKSLTETSKLKEQFRKEHTLSIIKNTSSAKVRALLYERKTKTLSPHRQLDASPRSDEQNTGIQNDSIVNVSEFSKDNGVKATDMKLFAHMFPSGNPRNSLRQDLISEGSLSVFKKGAEVKALTTVDTILSNRISPETAFRSHPYLLDINTSMTLSNGRSDLRAGIGAAITKPAEKGDIILAESSNNMESSVHSVFESKSKRISLLRRGSRPMELGEAKDRSLILDIDRERNSLLRDIVLSESDDDLKVGQRVANRSLNTNSFEDHSLRIFDNSVEQASYYTFLNSKMKKGKNKEGRKRNQSADNGRRVYLDSHRDKIRDVLERNINNNVSFLFAAKAKIDIDKQINRVMDKAKRDYNIKDSKCKLIIKEATRKINVFPVSTLQEIIKTQVRKTNQDGFTEVKPLPVITVKSHRLVSPQKSQEILVAFNFSDFESAVGGKMRIKTITDQKANSNEIDVYFKNPIKFKIEASLMSVLNENHICLGFGPNLLRVYIFFYDASEKRYHLQASAELTLPEEFHLKKILSFENYPHNKNEKAKKLKFLAVSHVGGIVLLKYAEKPGDKSLKISRERKGSGPTVDFIILLGNSRKFVYSETKVKLRLWESKTGDSEIIDHNNILQGQLVSLFALEKELTFVSLTKNEGNSFLTFVEFADKGGEKHFKINKQVMLDFLATKMIPFFDDKNQQKKDYFIVDEENCCRLATIENNFETTINKNAFISDSEVMEVLKISLTLSAKSFQIKSAYIIINHSHVILLESRNLLPFKYIKRDSYSLKKDLMSISEESNLTARFLVPTFDSPDYQGQKAKLVFLLCLYPIFTEEKLYTLSLEQLHLETRD